MTGQMKNGLKYEKRGSVNKTHIIKIWVLFLYSGSHDRLKKKILKIRPYFGYDCQDRPDLPQKRILVPNADAVEYLKKEDEETRNRISSLEIGARIATAEEAIRPAVKPFVIEMRDGETLAGCYIFRIGEDEQLTPYSTVDVAGKPKFFLSKDQAKQYIDTLKRKCPAWAGYNFQIRQRSNAEDFEGVAKIAKWCRSHDVEFAHVKTLKDSNGIRVKFYKFPQKSWYRLEAHQDTRTSTSYTLISSGKIDTKVTNQLRLIERLKQIFRVEDEK